MSLIIAHQDPENLSHTPSSFNNIIQNSFTIPANSKIGLKSAELNITPVINIRKNSNDLFSVMLGNETPDKEEELRFDDTGEEVPNSKLRLTSQLLYLVQLDEGTYTRQDFITEIEKKINKYFNNQFFKNQIKITNSVSPTGENNGLIFNYPNQVQLPSKTVPTSISNPVHIYVDDNGAYDYTTNEFSAKLNNTWAGMECEKPIHPAGGGFSVLIPTTVQDTEFIIGLKRNTNENKNDFFGNFDVDETSFPDQSFLFDIDDYYFDYMVHFDGTDLRLYNLKPTDRDSGDYEFVEVEYWNTADYGGSSTETKVIDGMVLAHHPIEFHIDNEMVSVVYNNNVISSDQLKATNNNTSSLYGKLYIKTNDYTKDIFEIQDSHFNLDWIKTKVSINGDVFTKTVDGYDYWVNQLLAIYNDDQTYTHYQTRDCLIEADYWAGLYSGEIADKIFEMKDSTDVLPAGLWIEDYNKTLDSGGTYLKYDLNQTPRFIFFGDFELLQNYSNLVPESKFKLNFALVYKNILDFDNYRNLNNDSIDWLLILRDVIATKNVYVRLNNFGSHISINGGSNSVSKIISEIDITDEFGITYYQPSQIIYLNLKNSEEFKINNIDIDIVDEKERIVGFLENGTSIILHLTQ